MGLLTRFGNWAFAVEEQGEAVDLLRELLYVSARKNGTLTITHIEAVDIDVERLVSLDDRFTVSVREFDYQISINDRDLVTKIRSFGY